MAEREGGKLALKLSIPIPVQLLRDLLCTAVEGGSKYWCRFVRAERTADLGYLSVDWEVDDDFGDTAAGHLTAEDLLLGLERLATAGIEGQPGHIDGGFDPGVAMKHFADAITENGDATTADVVFQMAVFGEVVYG